MCFIVIAVPDDMGESEPILIDKYPTKEQAEEVKEDLISQNKKYWKEFERIGEETKPKTADELGITNTVEYINYLKTKREEQEDKVDKINQPHFLDHEIYVF